MDEQEKLNPEIDTVNGNSKRVGDIFFDCYINRLIDLTAMVQIPICNILLASKKYWQQSQSQNYFLLSSLTVGIFLCRLEPQPQTFVKLSQEPDCGVGLTL